LVAAVTAWLLAVALVSPPPSIEEGCVQTQAVARVRAERITGSLVTAESEARRLLECPDLSADQRLALQLELAKTLDRIGLHTNTRPVTEALQILRQAEASLRAGNKAAEARVSLALAQYFYRAEMRERQFTTAIQYAVRADELFGELGDPAGSTDAVHLLGLIELQRHNLLEARELFDRSLETSRNAPPRLIFLSDYHRHVGIIDLWSNDRSTAIAHFGQSLAYRDAAGSRDYALFARTLLGSTLIDDNRALEAGPYLNQALVIARELPSPVGELRATYSLAEMYEAAGSSSEAMELFGRANELATELGVENLQKAAQDGLMRLESAKIQRP